MHDGTQFKQIFKSLSWRKTLDKINQYLTTNNEHRTYEHRRDLGSKFITIWYLLLFYP